MKKKPTEYKDQCFDCGKKNYPKKRDMGAIGVAIKRCPECGMVKGVVPARDWAYRAGDLEKIG